MTPEELRAQRQLQKASPTTPPAQLENVSLPEYLAEFADFARAGLIEITDIIKIQRGLDGDRQLRTLMVKYTEPTSRMLGKAQR